MSNYNRTLSQLLLDHQKLEKELAETRKALDSKQNPASCSGDDFVVWKKEICSLLIDEEPPTDFKRLEFQDIWDQDVVLDWLEPVIHDYGPALVLHCHRVK